jgi:saccharopine dehydrogenase-like NADP-dependent oxidoreductase
MLELDEAARQAGITAIIGMGASPGVSNLLAVKAMAALDAVDTLITGWGMGDSGNEDFGDPGEGGTFGAATEHWVQQFTGKIRVRKNGGFREAAPMEKLMLNYPGRGQKAVHTVGHPEPMTLSLYRPEIQNSYNVMDFPPYLITLLKALAREVDTGKKTVAQAAEWIDGLMDRGLADLILSKHGPRLLLAIISQIIRPEPKYPGEFALATGTSNNRRQSVGVHLTADPLGGMDKMTMGAITGVPMAVGLKMLAQGSISRKGVFAPEAGIDPDAFFSELAPLCTPARRGVDDLLSINVSN